MCGIVWPPVTLTCALCSLHQSLSYSVPKPGLHLSKLIPSHQRHHQVWRSQAPLLCQHLIDQHWVCVSADPHKLYSTTQVDMSVQLIPFPQLHLRPSAFLMSVTFTFPLVFVGPVKSMSPTRPAAQSLHSCFILLARPLATSSSVSSTVEQQEQPSRTLRVGQIKGGYCYCLDR